MNMNLNLDHDEARALHRIARAMHDGECPQCHAVNESEKMRKMDPATKVTCEGGYTYKELWRCPECGFEITVAESEAIFRLFAPFMERNLAVFLRWREDRSPRLIRQVCSVCGGHGVLRDAATFMGEADNIEKCSNCAGTGWQEKAV